MAKIWIEGVPAGGKFACTDSDPDTHALEDLRRDRDEWRARAIEAEQELAELQRLVDGGLMTYDSDHD